MMKLVIFRLVMLIVGILCLSGCAHSRWTVVQSEYSEGSSDRNSLKSPILLNTETGEAWRYEGNAWRKIGTWPTK